MRLDKQIKNVENGISVPLKELFFVASQGFLVEFILSEVEGPHGSSK